MTIDDLYQEIYAKNIEWSNKNEPLMVAGIFLAQALRIYKTVLPSHEYESMIQAVINNSDEVKPLFPKQTLH